MTKNQAFRATVAFGNVFGRFRKKYHPKNKKKNNKTSLRTFECCLRSKRGMEVGQTCEERLLLDIQYSTQKAAQGQNTPFNATSAVHNSTQRLLLPPKTLMSWFA